MKLETFFEKFEVLAEMPGGIPAMRELALEMAVRGSLTDRGQADHEDAAWTEFIHELDNRVYSYDPGAEPPFDIPDEWRWVSLEDLGTTKVRNALDDRTPVSFVPMSLIPAEYGRAPRSEERAWGEVKKTFTHFADGDVVLAKITPCFENGKSALMRGLVNGAGAGTTELHVFRRDTDAVIPEFVLIYLKSRGFIERGEKRMTGSAGQKRVPRDYFSSSPFPLPPPGEQQRIVAKVDELMALCDRLEAQQLERETRHTALARASLAHFADAPTPANLSVLFHPTFAIPPADLRKSILTLAVQGKLAPQDPNDEPAQELAARIARERASIATEQQVRLPKAVPPITGDDCAHEVPESWQWSRIGQLALAIDYGTSQKADDDSSKVPVYRMGNIVGGRLVDENLKYVDESIDDLPGLYLKTGDILFNRTNSYELVGKTGIYTGPADTATFASYLIRIRLPDTLLFPPFFGVVMNAPYYRQTQIEPNVVQQCGQANFNGTKLAATVVPLPPLAEQRRIVAKVEQLMTAVDEMETQLNLASASATKILAAISISLRAS